MDAAVSVAATLVTANGSWDMVAAWLPRSVIVPLALGQGLLLLAAATLLGVFMLAVGYPDGSAIFAPCCAAYALAVYGRRAGGSEVAGTLRGTAAVLAAALALAVAALAPGARSQPGA